MCEADQGMQSPSSLAAVLMARAPVGALLVMKSGVIAYADGAVEASIGEGAGSVCGRALVSLMDDEKGTGASELTNALSQPQACAVLVRLRPACSGEPSRSVTAFVQAEDEVSRRQGYRAVYFKPATASLDDAPVGEARSESARVNERVDSLLARISHEVKTPLNAVIGFAELLRSEDVPMQKCSQSDKLRKILESAWYLNELVDGMRELAELRRTSTSLQLAAVDVFGVLNHVMDMLRSEAFKRQIAIGLAVSTGVSMVRANKTRLEQVLVNLLGNAVKYCNDGGSVMVEVKCDSPGAVSVEVRNTGAGLTDAQLATLFEPFNRLGRESSMTPGSGIGLALCRRLVELMNGTLSASSAVGEWTRFRLVLRSASRED